MKKIFIGLIALLVLTAAVFASFFAGQKSYDHEITENYNSVVLKDNTSKISLPTNNVVCEHTFAHSKISGDLPCSHKCTKCGYVANTQHTWEEYVDDSWHGYQCSCCQATNYTAHNYQYSGYYNLNGHENTCPECHHSIIVAHDYETTGLFDVNEHQIKCKVCGYKTTSSHVFLWKEVDGIYKHVCSCGFVDTATNEKH